MTLFDIFALCAIGLSVVLAMMRGLVGEVLSLVSWVLSLIAAKMAAQPLAETVFSFIRPSALAAVAGFIAAFAAALLLLFFLRSLLTGAFFLRSLLTGAIKAIGLGGVNRFLGAVFGLLRGFAVVTLVVLVCAFTDLPKSDEWQNAYSSPFFEGAASVAVPYLPEYLAKKVSYPSF